MLIKIFIWYSDIIIKFIKGSLMDIKEYMMCDIISFKTGIDKNNINSFNSINSLPWIKLGNINEHNVNDD